MPSLSFIGCILILVFILAVATALSMKDDYDNYRDKLDPPYDEE